MDNARVIVVSEGRPHFDLAMQLAFESPTATATFWEVDQKPVFREDSKNVSSEREPTDLFEKEHPRLIFYWSEPSGRAVHPLPFPMKWKEAAEFAWGWLKNQDYGEQPDHDGSNGKGFAVYDEAWGRVGGKWEAICAISPQWAWYGK